MSYLVQGKISTASSRRAADRHPHSPLHQMSDSFLGIYYAHFSVPVDLQCPLPPPALVHRVTAGSLF